jgi:hypothetical protein
MGKTIRRKNYTPEWVGTDYELINGVYIYTKLTGKEYKKALKKFHRDTPVGFGNNGHAPKDFNKMLNRIKRSKMKAEVRSILLKGDYDDYSFDKWVKDAGWYYW